MTTYNKTAKLFARRSVELSKKKNRRFVEVVDTLNRIIALMSIHGITVAGNDYHHIIVEGNMPLLPYQVVENALTLNNLDPYQDMDKVIVLCEDWDAFTTETMSGGEWWLTGFAHPSNTEGMKLFEQVCDVLGVYVSWSEGRAAFWISPKDAETTEA